MQRDTTAAGSYLGEAASTDRCRVSSGALALAALRRRRATNLASAAERHELFDVRNDRGARLVADGRELDTE